MRDLFKVAEGLNTWPILRAVQQNPELWERHTFRQTVDANRETESILLRYQPFTQNELGQANTDEPTPAVLWTCLHCEDAIDYGLLPEVRPLVEQVMIMMAGEQLGRVILVKLPPGERVYVHDDRGNYVDFYTRIAIPILSDEGNAWRVGNTTAAPRPGEAWVFNFGVEHEAYNSSAQDRIVLFVDVRVRQTKLIEVKA